MKQLERFIYDKDIITIDIIMVTILKNGYMEIMQLFYDDMGRELHLREIARRADMHLPSVTRFLERLEEDQILKSDRKGNLKLFRVKKTRQAYLVFTSFDVERYQKLPRIRKKAIKAYMEKLDQVPVFAVLFGSTAKGTQKKESDMDILLVTNKKISTKDAENEADALAAVKINTFQIEYNDFVIELKLKEDKVIQSAINSGYPIVNHISYYEVLDERI